MLLFSQSSIRNGLGTTDTYSFFFPEEQRECIANATIWKIISKNKTKKFQEEGASFFFPSLLSLQKGNVVYSQPCLCSLKSSNYHLSFLFLLCNCLAFFTSAFRTSGKGWMGNGVLGLRGTTMTFIEYVLRPNTSTHVPLPQNMLALLCLGFEEF